MHHNKRQKWKLNIIEAIDLNETSFVVVLVEKMFIINIVLNM